MTKEQEEAIEMLEDIKNNSWTTKYIMSSDSAKAETVLNMLKEKDKDIKSIEKALHDEILENYDKQKNLKAEIEKKDKIIDLMAEQLAGLTIWDNEKEEPLILKDKEQIKQYFERKAKE